MSHVKKAAITAMCIALCCVLPPVFHAVGLGGAFSPMHVPVLLCGLVCGPLFGLFCGLAGPVLSSLITSMPAPLQLLWMAPELMVYGLAAGLCYQTVRTGKTLLDVYGSLLAAMVLGRVAGGAARWLYCLAAKQPYSLSLWAGAYVTQSLPGMVLHLVLVPTLLLVLYRAGLIPPHYPKEVSKHG